MIEAGRDHAADLQNVTIVRTDDKEVEVHHGVNILGDLGQDMTVVSDVEVLMIDDDVVVDLVLTGNDQKVLEDPIGEVDQQMTD